MVSKQTDKHLDNAADMSRMQKDRITGREGESAWPGKVYLQDNI